MTLALTLLLLAILDISVAPTFGYSYFHDYLYKHTITLSKVKKLQFIQAVVIEGKLKNVSEFDFKSCQIHAKIVKKTGNKYKDILFRFKPITKKIITVNNIPKNADIEFKFLIEPFTYQKDFNATVSGVCK